MIFLLDSYFIHYDKRYKLWHTIITLLVVENCLCMPHHFLLLNHISCGIVLLDKLYCSFSSILIWLDTLSSLKVNIHKEGIFWIRKTKQNLQVVFNLWKWNKSIHVRWSTRNVKTLYFKITRFVHYLPVVDINVQVCYD